MEGDQASKPVETDNIAGGRVNEAQDDSGLPAENEVSPESNLKDAKDKVTDDSHDKTRESFPRTSTRLVKFQLFETKSVFFIAAILTSAFLCPWLQSERDAQSHPQD
jgi:hypothetical protein